MKRKLFWLWFLMLLLMSVFSSALIFVVVGADVGEETAIWRGHLEERQSTYLHSSAYSSSTFIEWNKTYGGAEIDDARSVEQTNDGGYIVAGSTQSFGFGQDASPDAWLIKFFPAHDVAITEAEPSKTVVGQGYSLSIRVVAKNPGFFTESFNITAYANDTVIGTQAVNNLSPEASRPRIFTWNTTGFAKGNYTISANATTVPDETDTTDNTLTDGTVHVTIPGDVNGNFHVFLYDAVIIAAHYGQKDP